MDTFGKFSRVADTVGRSENFYFRENRSFKPVDAARVYQRFILACKPYDSLCRSAVEKFENIYRGTISFPQQWSIIDRVDKKIIETLSTLSVDLF